MHLKRSSQARRASSAKVISSGTFSQAYSSIPVTGEEPLTRSRKACKMQKKDAVGAGALKNPEDGFQTSSYTFLHLNLYTRVQPS